MVLIVEVMPIMQLFKVTPMFHIIMVVILISVMLMRVLMGVLLRLGIPILTKRSSIPVKSCCQVIETKVKTNCLLFFKRCHQEFSFLNPLIVQITVIIPSIILCRQKFDSVSIN